MKNSWNTSCTLSMDDSHKSSWFSCSEKYMNKKHDLSILYPWIKWIYLSGNWNIIHFSIKWCKVKTLQTTWFFNSNIFVDEDHLEWCGSMLHGHGYTYMYMTGDKLWNIHKTRVSNMNIKHGITSCLEWPCYIGLDHPFRRCTIYFGLVGLGNFLH